MDPQLRETGGVKWSDRRPVFVDIKSRLHPFFMFFLDFGFIRKPLRPRELGGGFVRFVIFRNSQRQR